MRPLIVIEGSDTFTAAAVEEVRAAGFRVENGWRPAGSPLPGTESRIVRTGRVETEHDAAAAVFSAVCGAGVVANATGERSVCDQLVDDLRRLGPVDHRVGQPVLEDQAPLPRLSTDDITLLDLMAQGYTIGEASRKLHMSRRTIDRRLAVLRSALGARTTAEALVVAEAQLGSRAPDPTKS